MSSDEPNLRGRKAAKTRKDIWFIITSWPNQGSGGRDSGPSCTSWPKGVTASYQSTNIENSIPFKMWCVLCSRLDNAPGIRLCLSIYLKILLFIQFTYDFFIIFFWSICTYGMHFLIHIIICLWDHFYFYYLYTVILIILTHNYIVNLISLFDNQIIV